MQDLGNIASTIDYEMLFDRDVARSYYGVEPEPRGRYYDDDRGMFVTAPTGVGNYIQDLIRFAPDAFAFTGSGAPQSQFVRSHCQVVGEEDWLHFCLRFGVAGFEDISGYQVVDQPSRVATIIRYPAHTMINRISPTEGNWAIACLWLRPSALRRLLELSASRLPQGLAWLTEEKSEQAHHLSVPLSPQLNIAVSDILTSQFKGGLRRAFIFAKYLEILSTLIHNAIEQDKEPLYKVSERDLARIHDVAALVKSRLDGMESLATLARTVGISRTKLILGFRALYGTSVESYWRDWRMQQANDLLIRDGLSVGEVAHMIGFSEISSFTRAFTRQFGVSPSEKRVS